MKLRWALLIMILAVGWTLPALATPQIVIGDPGCNTPGPFTSFQIANSNSFTITPVSGGGYFAICNESGNAWTNVDISFTSSTLTVDQIECTTANGVFNSPCTITKNGDQFDLLFSGGTGIPASCEGDENAPTEPGGDLEDFCLMTVNLNTNGSTTTTGGDWDSIVLSGRADVPEPATFALLGSGLAGLWQYRRRRK